MKVSHMGAASPAPVPRAATEAPFGNAYDGNKRPGIYVDIVSGEPLFSSTAKFESGTGWPSFTMPLAPGNIVTVTDATLGMLRVEVRSRYADSHLGHVFDDGPAARATGLNLASPSAGGYGRTEETARDQRTRELRTRHRVRKSRLSAL
jgi:methionine-R-sulfoxide reductase